MDQRAVGFEASEDCSNNSGPVLEDLPRTSAPCFFDFITAFNLAFLALAVGTVSPQKTVT